MVLDHMELESQLAGIATENGVELPSGPAEEAKQGMANLQTMSGSKFDTAFMQDIVRATSMPSKSSRRRGAKRKPSRLKPLLPQHCRSWNNIWRWRKLCNLRSRIEHPRPSEMRIRGTNVFLRCVLRILAYVGQPHMSLTDLAHRRPSSYPDSKLGDTAARPRNVDYSCFEHCPDLELQLTL